MEISWKFHRKLIKKIKQNNQTKKIKIKVKIF